MPYWSGRCEGLPEVAYRALKVSGMWHKVDRMYVMPNVSGFYQCGAPEVPVVAAAGLERGQGI